MARYLVQASHTPAECLQGLDEILAQGPDDVAKYDFACAVGDHSDHRCYTTVEADSEGGARNTLPIRIRGNAQLVEVGKFTPDQIRSFHKGG